MLPCTIATYYSKRLTLKKEKMETISTQLYTFEYVTWPYDAKTYINSMLDGGVLNVPHQCVVDAL